MFAHTGVRVLLVDVDLRRPRCHKVLGMDNTLGLTEVLAGARLREGRDPRDRHRFSYGCWPPDRYRRNPSELVGSEKMRETLDELTRQFDVVILDSPPILPVTDAILLSTMVDGVVLVVNSSKTAKQHVRAACAARTSRAPRFSVCCLTKLTSTVSTISTIAATTAATILTIRILRTRRRLG